MSPKIERVIISNFIEYLHRCIMALDLEFGMPDQKIEKFKCHTHNFYTFQFGKHKLEIAIKVKENEKEEKIVKKT